MGGMCHEEDVGFVDVLDLKLQQWCDLKIPDMLEPRSCALACATAGRVYVLGGQQIGPVEYVESLDLWSRRWRRHPDLPERFSSSGAALMAL